MSVWSLKTNCLGCRGPKLDSEHCRNKREKTQNQKRFKTVYYQPIKDLSHLHILHSETLGTKVSLQLCILDACNF